MLLLPDDAIRRLCKASTHFCQRDFHHDSRFYHSNSSLFATYIKKLKCIVFRNIIRLITCFSYSLMISLDCKNKMADCLINWPFSSDDRDGLSRKMFESRANRVIDCQAGSSRVILRFEIRAKRVKN